MTELDRTGAFNPKFLAVVLLLCAAGALWLLLSPTAFRRRAMSRGVVQLEAEKHSEWLYNVALERWRDGLQSDPSVIEQEARKLGYGRSGERVCPVRPAPLPPPRRLARSAGDLSQGFSWIFAIRRSIAPALMLVIVGFIAILFFTDLRVEYPAESRAKAQEDHPSPP